MFVKGDPKFLKDQLNGDIRELKEELEKKEKERDHILGFFPETKEEGWEIPNEIAENLMRKRLLDRYGEICHPNSRYGEIR